MTDDVAAMKLAGTLRREPPAAQRRGLSRYFFVGLGVLYTIVAIVGFAPSVYKYFIGEVSYPPVVHVHAVLMLGWVVLFTTQAGFAASGKLIRHRQVGFASLTLAAALWISMGVVSIAALVRYDPAQYGFLIKPLLIQLGLMVAFPIFLTWGVLARRESSWHKRLMTFATLTLLQAAVDRMNWLPNEGLPMFWHYGVRLYVLMLPLFVFDIVTLRRIHPATLIGAGLIVAMHGVITYYANDPGWKELAMSFWMSLR
ncbi:MAG: hypothetical protein Q8R02_12890 [Hyphomonadaceae bacterium]|nr:hypothetical protein [Hyphomonadaceae bacterium]